MKPLVSIITVNYRNEKDTCAFLSSIENAAYDRLEVIVVDNAPLADHSALFKAAFPKVIYVYSAENLGFAGGNNRGMQHASGELYYFLNNDTELLPNSILPLVEEFHQNEKLAAISPLIAFHSQPDTLQFAGMTALNPITGRNHMLGQGEKVGRFMQKGSTSSGYAHGAAMMVNQKAIAQTGPMDEAYFLYYEELDWCERFRKNGWEIKVTSEGLVHHKASASVGRQSKLQVFYQNRNRILFQRKHLSAVRFLLFFAYFITLPQLKFFLRFAFSQPEIWKAFYQGWREGLRLQLARPTITSSHSFT